MFLAPINAKTHSIKTYLGGCQNFMDLAISSLEETNSSFSLNVYFTQLSCLKNQHYLAVFNASAVRTLTESLTYKQMYNKNEGYFVTYMKSIFSAVYMQIR